MNLQFARVCLIVGMSGFILLCCYGVVDNYNLGFLKAISTKLECSRSETYDTVENVIKDYNLCSVYNPQFVFYACLCGIALSFIIFKFLNNLIINTQKKTNDIQKAKEKIYENDSVFFRDKHNLR